MFLLIGTGNQRLQFKIMMLEKESITFEVQTLRLWIAKKTSVHPGEILITALNIEPELVMMTFLMKDRHANTFLKYVQTNAGKVAFVKRMKTIFEKRT